MFIDPFESNDLKGRINENIKKIEEISKYRQDIKVESEEWFQAWNLVKATAEMIEQLSEESRKLENRLEN